mmetsp:Transcript_16042/g.54489  ORF Transcript_16042/g.54489 Transcript_16042/m.54489 type:complete len:133 (+) Transcript_16042:224-622(+)
MVPCAARVRQMGGVLSPLGKAKVRSAGGLRDGHVTRWSGGATPRIRGLQGLDDGAEGRSDPLAVFVAGNRPRRTHGWPNVLQLPRLLHRLCKGGVRRGRSELPARVQQGGELERELRLARRERHRNDALEVL